MCLYCANGKIHHLLCVCVILLVQITHPEGMVNIQFSGFVRLNQVHEKRLV